MAVKMRLRREGKKKQPYYRIVVADVRSPRDGRFIEDLGFYQPLAEPSAIGLDHERALHWLRNGAQPSEAVVNLLRIEGVWAEFKPDEPDAGADRRERRAAKRRARSQRDESAAATPSAAAEDVEPAPQAPAAEDDAEPSQEEPAAEGGDDAEETPS